MHATLKNALTFCAMVVAGQALAQVTFYQNENFQGPSFSTQRQVANLERFGFNDRASSAVVAGNRWEVCYEANFYGRCVVLRPGQYASLAGTGLNNRVSSARAIGRNVRVDESRYATLPVAIVAPTAPQVVLFESEGFQGRSITVGNQIDDLTRFGFNDRASSVVVVGDRWEACDDARFGGRCVVLRPGRYPSLAATGLNNRLSSVRALGDNIRINDDRYAPLPEQIYDNRPRNGERLYLATVKSVHAVVGPAEQRCWVERAPVAGNPNVGGAIVGAVIGGILGHQVGGGTGKDVATAGGAIAGAVAGRNISRNNSGQPATMQRCESQPSQAQPQYWDVTYMFQGLEHRVQMTNSPGPTITVNAQGEPRA